MLIASIIVTAFLLIGYVGALIFSSKKDKTKYEFKAKSPKSLLIFANFSFFLFGLGLSALSIVLSAANVEKKYSLPFILSGVFFGLITLLLIFLTLFNFVAIRGSTIYVRNFIRIREYKIDDVESIDFFRNTYSVVGKNFGFNLSERSPKSKEIIHLIRKRKDGKIYSLGVNTLEENTTQLHESDNNSDRTTILSEIGKEFRNNFPRYRRNQLLGIGMIMLSFVLIYAGAILFLSIYSNRYEYLISLFIIVPLIIGFLFTFFRIKENLNKELEHTDEWLGNKHKFDNKKVKGAAKNQHFGRFLVLIICAVGLALIGALFGVIVFEQKPVPQSRLTLVTGQFEYTRAITNKNSTDYAIGLKNDTTEYRISAASYQFFDRSFDTDVSVGDVVEIYIDSEGKPASLDYNDRTSWTYAYTIKDDVKEYLSYDNYITGFKKDRSLGVIVFVVCCSISALCAIGIVVSYLVSKSNSKKETIEV